jgi:threonine efflux protein
LLKLVGGAYLLWLGWRAARQAIQFPGADGGPKPQEAGTAVAPSIGRLYLQGLAMHLTNPKVILSWLAIVSLALPVGAPASATLPVVGACISLGLLVFGGYAVVFSIEPARRLLARVGRWLHGLLALVFGVAGIKLLLARS